MIRLFKPLAVRLYNSAIGWSLVFSLVRTAGNLLVLPLMLHKLPPADLGFWYVFLSLAGLSSLVDMGFFPTMSRVTAYLWAGAPEIPKMGVAPSVQDQNSPDSPNFPVLASLVRTMRLYYLGLGILITLAMAIFGTLWIMRKANQLPDVQTIFWAWLLFLPGILVNTVAGMWHPLLAGINEVRLTQQILVWSLVANYAVTFVGLFFGIGLFAPVGGYLAMGLIARTAAKLKFERFSRATEYAPSARWSPELIATLWPTAWRTGVVTLGIYATINVSTLICADSLGPATTASFGLSVQLALAAISTATAFISVKLPVIAQMHARGRIHEIPPLIFPRLRWFWLVYVMLSLIAITFGESFLRHVLHSKTPLLSIPLLIGLFAVIGLEGHHAVFRELTLSSHQNPFALPVVASGILIVVLCALLVRWIGLWGLIVAPGVVQLCFNNWWTVLVGLRSMGASPGEYFYALSRSAVSARVGESTLRK
jgi:O-antigen/teichoic acid export membrane protein